MRKDIENIRADIDKYIINSAETAEAFRLKFLSRKGGVISALFDSLRNFSAEEKSQMGKVLNELKLYATTKIEEKVASLSALHTHKHFDFELPGRPNFIGSVHPIHQTLNKIKTIFLHMGFSIATGPEIEKDEYNFSMLNFPENHPARDMQDTLFIRKGEKNSADDILLRTHTSPVQIRTLLNQKPPVRIIAPGKVYRNETISARSLCVFHQVEGLYVDKGVNFRDLKGTLYSFARQMFDPNVKIRFRPSFFPFTEPSAEMDISCYLCDGKGCRICKNSGWLEILGCGMVHPNVLRNCGLDPKEYQGFAFGMGVERTTLLQYQLTDIRMLYENDWRLLNQFSG